ncbi:MAG: sulfurtransferase, partial [Alphaproteobacteria bacterium]
RLQDARLHGTDDIILTGGRKTCELAAADLREMGCAALSWLQGDAEAWQSAGLSIVASPDEPADAERIDYLFFVHDRHTGNLEAARGYLEWELALAGQLDEQERGVFSPGF